MNWKLIVRLALLLCLVFNLFIIMAVLPSEETTYPGLIFWLFFIIFILCVFIPPAWVIAKRVHARRFLHGFIVGIIGWTIGFLFLMFPGGFVILILWPTAPADLGQGVGILGFFIWLLGVITSPGIGFFSLLAGKIFDKKTMIQNSKISSKDEQ